VDGVDVRVEGADFAKTIFQVTQDPETVMLRAVKKDKLVYQAEVPRDLYEETLTDKWQQTSPEPDAWMDYVLTNELWAKSFPDSDAPTDGTKGDTKDPDSAGSTGSGTTGGGQ